MGTTVKRTLVFLFSMCLIAGCFAGSASAAPEKAKTLFDRAKDAKLCILLPDPASEIEVAPTKGYIAQKEESFN